MRILSGQESVEVAKYFKAAADEAKKATCLRAKCGSVIVKNKQIIGRGYNSPPLDKEENRTCLNEYDTQKKPKYDKTCCIHAEWRAIIDALRHHPKKMKGSTLYFMRIDSKGNFTDAGKPFCTVCSRLALENGIKYFTLWDQKPLMYNTTEYNKLSFNYHK
jgi:deoxycytidylate deaminase